MTLTQLLYFCEVAKTRHFTAAANNLYVAQSSLSHAIRELESELDAPLFFRRSNKCIDLTDYGKALLPYAEAGLKMLEDGKNEVKSMRLPMFGSVKIDFFFSVALTIVPTLIQKFKEYYPDNQIQFKFEVNQTWIDLKEHLSRGQCDMIISASNITSDCESIQIARQKIVLILPINHPLANKDKVTPQDLANEDLIAIDINSNLDHGIKSMFKSANIEPQMTYVSNWTTQQLVVSTGSGIALSSDVPVDETLLTKVQIDSPLAIFPIYLTWQKNRKYSQATLLFRDYLIELSKTAAEDELIF